jgi:hypothetical protein
VCTLYIHKIVQVCEVSQEISYVVYSSLGSFYIPVCILIVVYTRIYMISRVQLRLRVKQTRGTEATLISAQRNYSRYTRTFTLPIHHLQ